MKKFLMSLIACLAIVQSTHAATSSLTQSIFEYDAILTALGTPQFENVIPQAEFIIDIRRITKQVNITGEVKYKIVTRIPSSDDTQQNVAGCGCQKDRHRRHTHTYIATLEVTPNPAIGPNFTTVVSIVRKQH